MPIEIIGAGWGRTGTFSLMIALDELGFPAYHMIRCMEKQQHFFWNDLADGKKVDWNTITKDYKATTDWPACSFYKELLQEFPNAKVILTVRDPQKWYDSAMATIFTMGDKVDRFPYNILFSLHGRMRRQMAMIGKVIFQGDLKGVPVKNREAIIALYEEHVREVKKTVPAHQLLLFDVTDGWEPLCQFLGVPVPSKPFPRVNDTASFQKSVKRRMMTFWGMLSLPVLLGAFLIWKGPQMYRMLAS